MPPILQLDLQQIISQAISFLLLLWILRRFAWRPLLTLLDHRRTHIEEELRRVAQSRAELARLQSEYSQRLAKIDEETRTKIQQAIVEGKRVAMEIQEQARAQGHVLINKAKETIELELAKSRVTLREQIVAMTMDVLEKILRQKLDPKTDRHLVDAILAELEQEPSRS